MDSISNTEKSLVYTEDIVISPAVSLVRTPQAPPISASRLENLNQVSDEQVKHSVDDTPLTPTPLQDIKDLQMSLIPPTKEHSHPIDLQLGLVGHLDNGGRVVTYRNLLQKRRDRTKSLDEIDSWEKLAAIQANEFSRIYIMYGLDAFKVFALEISLPNLQGVLDQAVMTNLQKPLLTISELRQIFNYCTYTMSVDDCPMCLDPPTLNILFDEDFFNSAVAMIGGDAAIREIYDWDGDLLTDLSFQDMLDDQIVALRESNFAQAPLMDLSTSDKHGGTVTIDTYERSAPVSREDNRDPSIDLSFVRGTTTIGSSVRKNHPTCTLVGSVPAKRVFKGREELHSDVENARDAIMNMRAQRYARRPITPSSLSSAPQHRPSAEVEAPDFFGCDPRAHVNGHKPSKFGCLTCMHYKRRCVGTEIVGGRCMNCRGIDGGKGARRRICYWPQPEKRIMTYDQARQFHGGRYIPQNTSGAKRERIGMRRPR